MVAAAAFFVALTSLYRTLDVMHRVEDKKAGLPGRMEEVGCLQVSSFSPGSAKRAV